MGIYPSWRYHRELEAKIIYSEAEEADGWVDTPAKFEVVEEVTEISGNEIIEDLKIEEKPKRGRKAKG